MRDVGPTLVVTILLDGPQLATRWTARYAGVLADDPGTAVLTLTANGMVERSRPTGMPPSTVVALWKDPTRGLREISLERGATGVLVSLAATRARRRVADGRTPVDNSAGLMVAGVFPVAPAHEVVPHASTERTVTGSALDAPDLTIVTAWCDAIAETLEHAPERVDDLIDDARPGAPWRAQLALPEPSVPLAHALAAVMDVVRSVHAGANGGRDAAILAALRTAPDDVEAPVSLARAVLRSALEARQDARAVVSRRG